MDGAGKSLHSGRIVLLYETCQKVRFTISQPKTSRHCALHERRHGHASHKLWSAQRTIVHGEIQPDITLERDERRHVDVHADVSVTVRAQRVGRSAAGRNRRVRGGDDRDRLTKLQRDLRAFRAAQLWLRHDARV